MQKTRFMVVSGFLGAGKTTTMIALGEYLDEHCGTAAIIANDLGAELVDTALTKSTGCKVAEIASGCICYQMDNLVDQVRRFRDRDGAFFVMSDIPGCGVGALGHVYHPLAREHADEFALAPFTVIVDPERLRMVMPEKADINLPRELVFLLQLQLEEADLVVLNKIDTLGEEELARDLGFLRAACPDTPVLAISARERQGIAELAAHLTSHESSLKDFEVDYDGDVAQAEEKLTWYNRRAVFDARNGEADFNAFADDLIEGIRFGLIEAKRNVPHLKTYLVAPDDDFNKASLIGVDYDTEYARLMQRPHSGARMIVNARATCEPELLAPIVDAAFEEACAAHDLDCEILFTECFNMG